MNYTIIPAGSYDTLISVILKDGDKVAFRHYDQIPLIAYKVMWDVCDNMFVTEPLVAGYGKTSRIQNIGRLLAIRRNGKIVYDEQSFDSVEEWLDWLGIQIEPEDSDKQPLV